MEATTHSPEETEEFAARFAPRLRPGDVLAMSGDLGAGKTAFVRGLARGLGYDGPVQSPTFTLVNEYLGGRLPLFHFDLYRLSDPEELYDLGFEEYPDRGGVCAVEWSSLGGDLLRPTYSVTLRYGGEDSARHIEIQEVSPC